MPVYDDDIEAITLTPEEIAEAEKIAMERLLANLAAEITDGSQEAIEKIYGEYYVNEVDKHAAEEEILSREDFSDAIKAKRT